MLHVMKTRHLSERPREREYDLTEFGPPGSIIRHGFPGIPDPPYVREHDAVLVTHRWSAKILQRRLDGRSRRERRAGVHGAVPWNDVASLAVRATTLCGIEDVQTPLDSIELWDNKRWTIGRFAHLNLKTSLSN